MRKQAWARSSKPDASSRRAGSQPRAAHLCGPGSPCCPRAQLRPVREGGRERVAVRCVTGAPTCWRVPRRPVPFPRAPLSSLPRDSDNLPAWSPDKVSTSWEGLPAACRALGLQLLCWPWGLWPRQWEETGRCPRLSFLLPFSLGHLSSGRPSILEDGKALLLRNRMVCATRMCIGGSHVDEGYISTLSRLEQTVYRLENSLPSRATRTFVLDPRPQGLFWSIGIGFVERVYV